MPGDQPSGWTEDGSSLYVFARGEMPVRVYRLNVQSGAKTPWKELQPYDIAGMYEASRVLPTPDGKTSQSDSDSEKTVESKPTSAGTTSGTSKPPNPPPAATDEGETEKERADTGTES